MLPAKSHEVGDTGSVRSGRSPAALISPSWAKARKSKRNIMQEFEVLVALNGMRQLVSAQYFKHIHGQIVFRHIFKLTAFKEIAIRMKHVIDSVSNVIAKRKLTICNIILVILHKQAIQVRQIL